MNRLGKIAILGSLGLSAMIGCQPSSDTKTQTEKPTPVGSPVELRLSDIKMVQVNGSGTKSLADYKGSRVLLYFFAPWTDSGKASEQWLTDFQLDGLTKIPVIIDQRSAKESSSGDNSTYAGHEAFSANDDLMTALGGVRVIPTAILLDESGNVVKKWSGYTAVTSVVADIKSGPVEVKPGQT